MFHDAHALIFAIFSDVVFPLKPPFSAGISQLKQEGTAPVVRQEKLPNLLEWVAGTAVECVCPSITIPNGYQSFVVCHNYISGITRSSPHPKIMIFP